MKEENQIIIRCLNKYGKVPETYDLLEKIDLLEEENQRLNNDIKILLKENEAKEKVIIEYENMRKEVINKLKEHKKDLDYEPWSLYEVRGSILFNLVNILNKVGGSDE